MDLILFNFIHGFWGVSGVLNWFGVAFAEYLPYALACAAVIVIFRIKAWRVKMWTFLVAVFSLLVSYGFLSTVIHYLYPRPRPFTALGFTSPFAETSSSFPSNHATFFFAIAYVMFLVNRKYGYWFTALALLNGLARVFVGVHWPLDIVGGALVALAGFLVTLKVFPKQEFTEVNEAAEDTHVDEVHI